MRTMRNVKIAVAVIAVVACMSKPCLAERNGTLAIEHSTSSGPLTCLFWRVAGKQMIATTYSNAVMGIVDLNGDGFQPPTTNPARLYVDPNDATNQQSGQKQITFVGYNGSSYSPIYANRAKVKQTIYNVNLGVDRLGCFRIFSDPVITNAAYYVDSDAMLLKPLTDNASSNMYKSYSTTAPNPAYSKMRVSNPVQTDVRNGLLYLMTGTVNTVSGGATNTLYDSDVMVWWRTNSDPWKALQGFGAVNGAFTGWYEGGSEVIVGMPASGNALPNSEAYQGPVHVTPVPEPALAVVGLLIAALLRKR